MNPNAITPKTIRLPAAFRHAANNFINRLCAQHDLATPPLSRAVAREDFDMVRYLIEQKHHKISDVTRTDIAACENIQILDYIFKNRDFDMDLTADNHFLYRYACVYNTAEKAEKIYELSTPKPNFCTAVIAAAANYKKQEHLLFFISEDLYYRGAMDQQAVNEAALWAAKNGFNALAPELARLPTQKSSQSKLISPHP